MKQLVIAVIGFACLTFCITNSYSQSVYSVKVENLKRVLEETDLVNNYNGVILIADGENVLFQNSYGTNENKGKNALNSRFGTASMGKMFASVAIMQLIEGNRIFLDQSIGEILEYYPNESAKEITIKQLLTHTSGLGDYFSPEFDKNWKSIKTLKDYLPFFANDPLEFKPGEGGGYSNSGFIVLGLIIEEVSGTDYASYIEKEILIPSGMTSSGPMSSPAGGGYTTASDLHKFAVALQNNKLIRKKSLEKMTTDHFGHGYGYGMSLRNVNGIEMYGHSGGAPGFSADFNIVKDKPLITVLLSNRSRSDGLLQVRTHFRKEFFGSTPKIEKFLNAEKVIKAYKEKGFEKASKTLTELNNNISDSIFGLAEQYASDGQLGKAIDVGNLIVQANPDKWYAYNSLADFQQQAGQKEEAIKNYKKSLEINPQNEQAIERLKELEQQK